MIDSCGFESYRLRCNECGIGLAGMIDPCDETLLLCEDAGEVRHEAVALLPGIRSAPMSRRRLLG